MKLSSVFHRQNTSYRTDSVSIADVAQEFVSRNENLKRNFSIADITRNRLWNTGAVTQESLQNSSLEKSLYLLLELKKIKVLFVFSEYVHSFCLQLSLWNAQVIMCCIITCIVAVSNSILSSFPIEYFYTFFLENFRKTVKTP